MSTKVQFLLDQNGHPTFAVIPYEDYKQIEGALESSFPKSPSLLSLDGTKISLPYGGPGTYLDLVQFVDFWDRRGILDMAVNQRAQTLDKFPPNQANTLDPIIRRIFLPAGSPYKNTMQATSDVVDALVETGLFKKVKRSYEGVFYRPVNAIEVTNATELGRFLKEKGRPKYPISLEHYDDHRYPANPSD